MEIAGTTFLNYKEYEAAYIKKWEALHPKLAPDLNWIKKDWDIRISNPELFK